MMFDLAQDGDALLETALIPRAIFQYYSYDRFGNRWNQTGPNTFDATFTGNNNRLDGYQYDSAGNLLNDKTSSYTYDAENRLIQVVNSSGTATYTYDANGRRVHRTGYTATTCTVGGVMDYVYDLSGHWIMEVNNNGTPCADEFYAGGRHIVSVRGSTTFSHTDWLGTERVRIEYPEIANRAYDEHCSSLPFGDGLTCTPSSEPDPGPYTSPLHFTGKERDFESGLDNFGARYDASLMGRFMSADVINLTDKRVLNPANTLNKYVYGGNNPLKYVDPDGRDITYFYDQGGFAGHAILFVYNQDNSQSAIESFGPASKSIGTRLREVDLEHVPAKSMYEMGDFTSADNLRQNLTALTIQTSPEITQQVLDYMKANPDPETWSALGSNCSSAVWEILNKFKLDNQHQGRMQGLTPKLLWNALIVRYNPASFAGTPRNGQDYGNPRSNMYDLLWLKLSGCHSWITSNKVGGGTESVCAD